MSTQNGAVEPLVANTTCLGFDRYCPFYLFLSAPDSRLQHRPGYLCYPSAVSHQLSQSSVTEPINQLPARTRSFTGYRRLTQTKTSDQKRQNTSPKTPQVVKEKQERWPRFGLYVTLARKPGKLSRRNQRSPEPPIGQQVGLWVGWFKKKIKFSKYTEKKTNWGFSFSLSNSSSKKFNEPQCSFKDVVGAF